MYDNFVGFTFKIRHTSEFHIYHVSNPYYEAPLFGEVTDNYKSVAGHVGAYYTNTIQGAKPFSINCAFHEMTPKELNDCKRWLYPDSFGTLIFDETPYLERYVKISVSPSFSFIPQSTSAGTNFTFSGTMTLQFLQIDPFDYATEQNVSSYASKGDYADIWENNSNILLTAQTPVITTDIINTASHLLMYNAGNIEVKPTITVTGSGSNIQIAREISTGVFEGNIVSTLDNETIVIDNEHQSATIGGALSTYRLDDDNEWLSLEGTVVVDRFDSATFTIGIGGIHELTLPSTDAWPTDAEGRYICINNNWYEVSDYVSTTQVLLETDSGLVDQTTYTDLVLAYQNDIYVTGDPLNKTYDTTGFGTTIANIKANSDITEVVIEGVTSTDMSGVNSFNISTLATTTNIYSVSTTSIFPLYNLPDDSYDYILPNDKEFYRNVESKTFDFDFCTLYISTTPITILDGVSLVNTKLFQAYKDTNNVTLYSLDAPVLYPERITIFKDGVGMTAVEVDAIDEIASIGSYYYEYEISNGIPYCSAYFIVSSTDVVPTETMKACFQVSIDSTTYENVDIIKLYTAFDETPATFTTATDGFARVWQDSVELDEISFLEIDSVTNAGTTFYCGTGGELWLPIAKDTITMQTLNTLANLFILYKRLSPEVVTLTDVLDLQLVSSTDALTYSATGGQTPVIEYSVELEPVNFSINLEFEYKHKYI